MKIKQIRIQNYKSWRDSGKIKLDNGLNVIVGQNNAGKTALLEGLSLAKGRFPHKTIISKPEYDSHIDSDSNIQVTLEFDEKELLRSTLLLDNDFFAPLPTDHYPIEDGPTTVKDKLNGQQTISVELKNSQIVEAEFEPSWYSEKRKYCRCKVNSTKSSIDLYDKTTYYDSNSGNNKLSSMLVEYSRNKIYLLRAERYNIGQSPVQHSIELLEQNCVNLAQVLHSLHSGNPERFNRVVDLLKKVFPRIKGVTVPVTNGQAKIVIWSVDPKTERKDLAVPLSESGTGVGQVLAMLYLIIYSDISQCILIDEPQSFLHPGAVRALLEILHSHKRHQYIITTHSPHILSIPSSQVIHVTHDGNESKAEVIEGMKAHEARLILQDIGFKLADVFGADRILWVEGPTEEECFKLIARTFKKEAFWGIEILGVRSTGDLHGKQAENAYDIYTTLSKGMGIIPPAVAFIFDKEQKSESQMNDLKRKSRGKLVFLSRRMYENYLLHPEAIAKALNSLDKTIQCQVDQVKKWINEHGMDKRYLKQTDTKPFEENWFVNVDGANLLKDLFSQISSTKISYDKVNHGYLLTQILIEENQQHFAEINELLDYAIQLGESQAC